MIPDASPDCVIDQGWLGRKHVAVDTGAEAAELEHRLTSAKQRLQVMHPPSAESSGHSMPCVKYPDIARQLPH